MGTRQSRQGHGRQGSRQQGQHSDRGQHDQQQGGDTSRQQGQQNIHGEGNYAASRQYDDATKAFTESGRVEPAARAAAPRSDADAREMAAAEAEGKRHSKGEDPALSRKASQKAPESPATPRPGQEEE